jgi:hypothetical protein
MNSLNDYCLLFMSKSQVYNKKWEHSKVVPVKQNPDNLIMQLTAFIQCSSKATR